MELFRTRLLDAMGVTVWRARRAPGTVSEPAPGSRPAGERLEPTVPAPETPTVLQPVPNAAADEEPLSLEDLAAQVAACRKCELADARTRTVFGAGNAAAEWMFVGEAPGAEEDRQGLPFVGRAGQLLNAMIAAIGLTREQVYIANVLKCRPPNNRDPLGEEVVKCLPYLRGQIGNIRPRIIVALGRFAAQALLETHTPIARLRGRVHRYGEFDTPLVVSYHPAYLLRSPLDKRKAWEDLKLAMRTIDGGAS